jgi:hypothetical protein
LLVCGQKGCLGPPHLTGLSLVCTSEADWLGLLVCLSPSSLSLIDKHFHVSHVYLFSGFWCLERQFKSFCSLGSLLGCLQFLILAASDVTLYWSVFCIPAFSYLRLCQNKRLELKVGGLSGSTVPSPNSV